MSLPGFPYAFIVSRHPDGNLESIGILVGLVPEGGIRNELPSFRQQGYFRVVRGKTKRLGYVL